MLHSSDTPSSRRSLAVGFLAFCLGIVSFIEANAAERKVLFIGIDGCRFDALRAAETPYLDQLIEEGCYDPATQILGDRYRENDTISGPGWSSILTGVWADKHGVNDNTFQGKNYQEYPHFFTRLKQARPEARTASIVDWVPIHLHIVSNADIGRAVVPVDNDYVDADVRSAEETAKILSEENPDAVFLYIGQVDETGHKVGFHPTVPEYIAAIERADALVGKALTAMRQRETYEVEEWLVLVTSDHGGQGTGHGGGHNVPEILNSFMIVSGPAAQQGRLDQTTYLVDVPVTALAYLGVELEPEWKLDGRPVGLRTDVSATAASGDGNGSPR